MSINVSDAQFIYALIISLFTGAISGYIGSLMLTKRMALVGGPLGHMTLPGITLALIYGFDVSIGALLFLSFGIIFIWILEKRTKIHMEALSAIVFASSLAVAFLFLPEEEISIALIGSLSEISPATVVIVTIVASMIFIITRWIYPKMVLISISEDVAKVDGIDSKKYNLIYLFCIAMTIALGVRIVGGLMTAALVAIPSSTSKNLTRSLSSYSILSLIVGSIATLSGITIYRLTNIEPGPLIIISSAAIFLLSVVFKKR